MAGIKGRSGRKSRRDEQKRLDIIDKAWDLVCERLNSKDPKRFETASNIVLRDITQTVKNTGESMVDQSINYKIEVVQLDRNKDTADATRKPINRLEESEQI